MIRTSIRNSFASMTAAAMLSAFAGYAVAPASAQDADPPSGQPEAEQSQQPAQTGPNGRRMTDGKTTTLAFDNVPVSRLIPFIVESTGKVVLPRPEILTRRVTVISDKPLPQNVALDYVFLALQQDGVGIVETEDLIILRLIEEIDRQDVPVIGPDESVLGRTDLGTIAEKVYQLDYSSAENLEDVLTDDQALPDYARIAFDPDSNSVVVRGNIALLQRMERLISALDRPATANLVSATFRLRYADATQLAENITELFQADDRSEEEIARSFFNRQRGRGGDNDEDSSASTSENLRVTVNVQQNSVTVLGEETVVQQIRAQIENEWDLPIQPDDVVPKTYELKHSDPVKVADLLTELFGASSGTTATSGTGRNATSAPSSGQGVGRLAGQFSFVAIPEAGRIMVIAKSPDNLVAIDEIIANIDQPVDAGLPEIIELKHANAEELAEQLNTLLAQENTIAQLPRQESGLSSTGATSSPFASSDDTATNNNTQQDANLVTFWWQRAQPPTDVRNSSNLIGRIRIVPVWRQNAVMVLSPPEYRSSIGELIGSLDKPGRQVLISAVIAEVSVSDDLSLGLRWGSGNINPANGDNAISVGTNTTGTQNDFLSNLFDTSVLSAEADLNLVFQALQQDGDVKILSEPRIFTSDNQEAVFFDGQDVPIVTDTNTTQDGNIIATREYRAVGISLRTRPRITTQGAVDLRVNLELSSIQPTQTADGFFIFDRRETTTQLIVQNGQTVVISGILRSEESDITRKVPLLGDIPIIGALFTSVERSTENAELVAFITPIVVQNDEEVQNLNEPYRQRLEDLRRQLNQLKDDDKPEKPSEEDSSWYGD
ncbi:MAG: secretin N-terminal domain-containing protein [Phycisphaerales bacterium]